MTDEIRDLIARLEPMMDSMTGTFVELEAEAAKLVDRLDRTFVSDISDVEALLLAGLVECLRRKLAGREKELKQKKDGALSILSVMD